MSRLPENLRERALRDIENAQAVVMEARELDRISGDKTRPLTRLALETQRFIFENWKKTAEEYKGIPKRRIKKRKTKTRSQAAKKMAKTRKTRV